MTTHFIKSWAHFYDAIAEGRKLHDLRRMDDREYNVGDILVLQRYDNINGKYTGEEQRVKVTYITSNKTPCAFSSSALDREYAILSLQRLPEVPAEGAEFVPNSLGLRREELPKRYGSTPNPNAEFYQNGGFGDNHG